MDRPTILVADPIAEEGIRILEQAGDVVVKTGLGEDELVRAVADADAIVVRSATKVTARVIAAAKRIKIIARAGVGTDNIDVEAATRHGVLVVNSPAGNTLAAAEHTIALLLAAARNIPQACAAMRAGQWDRSRFIGRQLFGKTLGIIGFGRIGREVARRARCMGMNVIVYDPFVSEEVINANHCTPCKELSHLLAESDFVSLHAQLTPQNRGMIGEEQLRQMKQTAVLVNCARGALIEEKALIKALREGWIAGAALDVFSDDKHPPRELLEMENVVATPHLGASTEEAQAQVAVDVAEQVVAVLQGRPARSPVNAPALPPEALTAVAPYLNLAQSLGRLAGALATRAPQRIVVSGSADLTDEHLNLLGRYALAEYITTATGQPANYVNATVIAAEQGVEMAIGRGEGPRGYEQWIIVSIEGPDERIRLDGALVGRGIPRLVRLGEFTVDLVPQGRTLVIWHGQPGKPGFIGRIGTLLGNRGISITGIEVSLEAVDGVGLMLVQVAQELDAQVLEEIQQLPGVLRTEVVQFGGAQL